MAKISRLEIPSAPLNDNELHFAFINFFVDLIYYRFQQLCVEHRLLHRWQPNFFSSILNSGCNSCGVRNIKMLSAAAESNPLHNQKPINL